MEKERIQELEDVETMFYNLCEKLKPLEQLYVKEIHPNEKGLILPDTSTVLKWAEEKIHRLNGLDK